MCHNCRYNYGGCNKRKYKIKYKYSNSDEYAETEVCDDFKKIN